MKESQAHKVSRRRSREEADRLVLEYEQSGRTRKAFCRQHGLSVATLDNYRKRRASSRATPSDVAISSPGRSAITFVALDVVEPCTTTQPVIAPREGGGGATLFVELAGGRRIGVASGFDASTLMRLISVLEGR